MAAKKTVQRVAIIEEIAKALKSKTIYSRIKVAKMRESEIRSFMYSYLIDTLEQIYRKRKPGVSDATIKRNADSRCCGMEIGVLSSTACSF